MNCGIKGKSKWFAAGAIALAAAALLFHAPLLRCFAGLLIDHEPIGDYRYVGVVGLCGGLAADQCYDVVEQLCRRRPSCRLLLVEFRRTRLAELGVLPSAEELGRRELKARGLSPPAVSVIHSDGGDDWATARTLRTWLADGRTPLSSWSTRASAALTFATCWIPCSIRPRPPACESGHYPTGNLTKQIGGGAARD